jgi:exopolyphosphatase/guanosine-5'-triphosphate,3'-diphosphate pyrophosphatase
MPENKIAVIDMGTNTFHLLLARQNDQDIDIYHKEKRAVQLGQGGISLGYIAPPAFDRAIRTLLQFHNTIQQEGVSRIYAVATSAVRNAANGKELTNRILALTGIEVHIISGEKEAELIYRGVKYALDLGFRPSLIMDVGGGSVEFILCNADKIYWKGSFEIGAQRLVDMFHKHDPISGEEIERMGSYLDEKLAPLFEAVSSYKPITLVGSSGSFDTLCDIDIHERGLQLDIEDQKEYNLPVANFERIFSEIIVLNKSGRLQIPGMIEMRADMIVVASILTAHIIRRLSVHTIRVSTFALKEGVLSKMLAKEEV